MSTHPLHKLTSASGHANSAAGVRGAARNWNERDPDAGRLRGRNLLECWHLLSLDAPTVATLWTWFIASANHIRLPLAAIVSMTVAVWMLYAGDRLMDARAAGMEGGYERLEARHYFHYGHRKAFGSALIVASVVLSVLLPHLQAGPMHLYKVLGALVFGYFVVIHAAPGSHRFPKEIAVGVFFAAATFVPTIGRRPELRLALLPSAVLFAILCSLNCLFIHAWEHESSPVSERSHAITALPESKLPWLAISLLVTGLASSALGCGAPWVLGCAVAMSAASLLLLHSCRRRIGPVSLRAAADLALVTPLLLMPLLRSPVLQR